MNDIGRMAKPSPTHSGNPALVSIGETVRSVRTKQGLSQEGLALAAELDRSYMGGIERGEHNLTVINLIRVSGALGLTPSELLKKSRL
ncbi:Xre family transcriptional regulator [Jezberella montanilacus]|uniref:Xre family transcriptional regulator n=2 Tax=Jezberella montanilacus TaxID=323426 RepID=A0A2T0XFL2_9BURK|nr:Xre family transcriptional regulator [Jezberella montanilacus]